MSDMFIFYSVLKKRLLVPGSCFCASTYPGCPPTYHPTPVMEGANGELPLFYNYCRWLQGPSIRSWLQREVSEREKLPVCNCCRCHYSEWDSYRQLWEGKQSAMDSKATSFPWHLNFWLPYTSSFLSATIKELTRDQNLSGSETVKNECVPDQLLTCLVRRNVATK